MRGWLVVVSVCVGLLALSAAAQVPPPDARAAASSWPHTLTANGVTVVIYQPQATSWPDRTKLFANAAIAVTPAAPGKPFLGTIELSLSTTVDEAAGVVRLSDPVLIDTHFPSLDTARAAAVEARLRAGLPQMQLHEVPLATVLLSLRQPPVPPVAVDNTPPRIFYADHPASLVVFDGNPVLAPIGSTGLSFAVNTNWDVFHDQAAWFLLNNGIWFAAPQFDEPYASVARLPAAFNALPKDASFADARRALPAHPPKPGAPVPEILVSTTPAAIIVTEGPPRFVPVAGTGLLRVANTASALYFHPVQGSFYVLLSGRWFASSGLSGPWHYATDKLPADFAMISPSGPDAAVLASVPGTVQAQEAVLRAQIPTEGTLKRDAVTFSVAYSGPPRFEPIPGTSLLYAVNTNAQVLQAGAQYFACENGVWFVASSPTGPWALADTLPPAIRTIPPTHPLYPLTYVQVYASTPSTVTYGYTAGYALGYVSAGVLVYGTGYYYPPVVVPGPVPVFYPYPYTYAGSVWYNSANGAWARGGTYYNSATGAWAGGAAVYGPNGGAGAWSAYNPSTGAYAHGSASWSNGSGSANAAGYNPRTGVAASTNQNWNQYSRWGSSTIAGPNQTVNTRSASNANGAAGGFSSSTGAAGAGYHNAATGNNGAVVKGPNGDVYAGHDGNVYQHSDSGWQKYDNGGWNPVTPPANNRQTPNVNTAPNNLSGSQNQNARTAAQPRSNQQPRSTTPAATSGSTYQQLEHDRLGREAGGGQLSAGQFGAGQFGGRYGSGGSGRFRR